MKNTNRYARVARMSYVVTFLPKYNNIHCNTTRGIYVCILRGYIPLHTTSDFFGLTVYTHDTHVVCILYCMEIRWKIHTNTQINTNV